MSFRSPVIVLLGIILCLAAIWAAFRLDRPVREAVVASQGPDWKKSASYKFHSTVRILGDWPPVIVAAAIALAAARLSGNRRWTRILAAAMIASTLAGILANTSRLTTGRTRPRESPKIEQGFYGPAKFGKSAYNSFPSGHAATAFGFALAIALSSPAWGIPAIAGAVLVCWSSIAIGAHHLSDIVVSFLLSTLVAWLVVRWMNRSGNARIDRLLGFRDE